jgi:predicted metal-dependent peptidase
VVAIATTVPPLDPEDLKFFTAARLRAARLQPYLSTALFAMVPVVRPGYGTFGVDRWWRVYLDMDVARDWGVAATAGVLVHEAHHLVRDHHGRADRLKVRLDQARLWNLAGDAAINDDLVADDLPRPDRGIYPESLGLPPNGFEEAYFRQLVARRNTTAHETCGSGSGNVAAPGEIEDEPEQPGGDGIDDIDAVAIRRAVAHDVMVASRRGDAVSPGLARWARDLMSPQVPWRRLLRSTVGASVRAVTTRAHPDWSRPSRRADANLDLLRPGRRFHRPDVAVVIDTSASMSKRLLDAAATELNGLLHRSGIREVTVVVCDAEALRAQRVRRLGDLRLVGGGGTDLRVGITAAASIRPTPSVIVVLTDGDTPWPRSAPRGTTLIAVVIGGSELPKGPGIVSVRIDEP